MGGAGKKPGRNTLAHTCHKLDSLIQTEGIGNWDPNWIRHTSTFVVRRGWRSSIIEAIIRVVTRWARRWIVWPASPPSTSPSQVTSVKLIYQVVLSTQSWCNCNCINFSRANSPSPETTPSSEVCPPSRARPCGLAMVEIHPWCGPASQE